MKRTLSLRRATLTELTPADLVEVVGAAQITHNCQSLDFCTVESGDVCVATVPVRACLQP